MEHLQRRRILLLEACWCDELDLEHHYDVRGCDRRPVWINGRHLWRWDRGGRWPAVLQDGIRVDDDSSPYVHTFRRPASASSWIYQAALASPAGDNALTDFGYRDSLSLSGDGSALVVGAPSLGVVNGSYVAGGIYTYRFSGASWGTPSLVTRSATTATPNRQMGYSVEISPDGLTMIAGAPDGSTTGAAGGGAVYRWTRSSVTALWVFTDTYTAGDTVTGDKFGSSVGLPGSAPSRPVVGAPFKDGVLTDAGAAYLY